MTTSSPDAGQSHPIGDLPCRLPDRAAGWILAIACCGDRQAFAALFNHFGPRLKAYLLRRGIANGVAEELVQEAMLRVWTKARLFDPDRASAGAWIYAITRNLLVDALRHDRDFDDDCLGEPSLNSGTPEDELSVAQAEKRLRTAMGKIPSDQAEILRLSFFEEWSHSEIARRLLLPLGTVKSRLRRAAAQLRLALGEVV